MVDLDIRSARKVRADLSLFEAWAARLLRRAHVIACIQSTQRLRVVGVSQGKRFAGTDLYGSAAQPGDVERALGAGVGDLVADAGGATAGFAVLSFCATAVDCLPATGLASSGASSG